MSDRAKSSLVDFFGEADKKKLLNYTRASQLPQAKAVIAAAVAVDAKQPDPQHNICEFARGFVYGGSDGRYCCDRTFCPRSLYEDAKVFVTCPTYLAKLKDKKEQP